MKKHSAIIAALVTAFSLVSSGCAGFGLPVPDEESSASGYSGTENNPTGKTAEGPAEEPTEESAEETAEESAEEPAEEAAKETALENNEAQPEDPPEQSSTPSDEENKNVVDFHDADGNEYEAETEPEALPNPYDPLLFKHDGDFLTYDDPDCRTSVGIDVSSHQGAIDWQQVKQSGIEFAFVRLGYRGYGPEGTLVADDYALENIDAAHEAGLSVGAYFFSQAVDETEAEEEASFAMSILEGRDLELPLVFDAERIKDDTARTDGLTGEQFTKNAEAFCEAVRSGGYEPMLYANLLWEAFVYDMAALSKYPFWYADYEGVPQTPYAFDYWQYSETGSVPGIDGYVDMDIRMH